MTDNAKIESAIIETIRKGNNRLSKITPHLGEFQFTSRQLDKRMQSMRKRGVISFSSHVGWTANHTTTA